ncbi:SDR family NAD(P)-dependent oxidoreductase [Brevundimonas intermedia]|uniref:SDR family NAD(P)-dependent oxidoreductase n=1 Tax=Brevundimonas intermedia TaxID=74315 RepID=UPI001ADDBCEF|nr:SDR family NAD(P)-dependent oxidoreductase [Brevundimonas intermedia]
MTDDLSAAAAEHVRPLAVVTGASSGIGYELAKLFAEDGYDLVVAADTPLAEAVQMLRGLGAQVYAVHVDLASEKASSRFTRPSPTVLSRRSPPMQGMGWEKRFSIKISMTSSMSSTPTSPDASG